MRIKTRYDSMFWILVAGVALNVVSCFYVFRKFDKPAVYNVTVEEKKIDPELIAKLTNQVYATTFSVRGDETPLDLATSEKRATPLLHADYQYYTISGKPCAEIYGERKYLGSRMSRGVIVAIYPDVIEFDNGDKLYNRRFSYATRDVVPNP